MTTHEPASGFFLLDRSGGVPVVRVTADAIRLPEQALEFGRDLAALVERDGLRALVVDLHRTHYLASTAFGALFALARRMSDARGKLALCALHPDLATGARILGLGTIVPIFATEAEAVAAV